MVDRLSSRELRERFFSALENSGVEIVHLTAPSEKPIRVALSAGTFGEPVVFRVFLWNITHGGATRSEDEFRIQLTGSLPDEVAGETTIVLGWSPAFEVFAGWSARDHQNRVSRSPSLQVKKTTLVAAYDLGLAAASRGGGDVVVALKPDLLAAYLVNADKLHMADPEEVLAEIELITPASNVPEPGAPMTPSPWVRPTHVREIAVQLRAWDFSKRVLDAYDHGCCICGIELMVIEAAHIVPVAWPGSTDETSNGLALCAVHHKAYDKKLISVNPDCTVAVSANRLSQLRALNRAAGEDELIQLDGAPLLRIPAATEDRPTPANLLLGQVARNWD